MENCIPEFWEREREWKKAFPTFGNGNGNEKLIPKLWEREWEAGIPGNGREREFPLTPAPQHFSCGFAGVVWTQKMYYTSPLQCTDQRLESSWSGVEGAGALRLGL